MKGRAQALLNKAATEGLCRSRAVPVVLVLLALPGLLLGVTA
ncbi:hypothetical protein GCM10017784_07080 [Deinococcus indicus]|nr:MULTISPECIES: hypothetical protein [Deinococcus]GHG18509.1 hypothetical protein GCM10017784_07080 [Deinococcus indicus]